MGKRKISLIFVVIMVVFLITPVNAVDPEDDDWIETMEDDIVGGQADDVFYGVTWLETNQLSSNSRVIDTWSKTGDNSYFFDANGNPTAFVNLTYSDLRRITWYNFSCQKRDMESQISNYAYYYFCNVSGTVLLALRWSVPSSTFQRLEYQTSGGGWTEIETTGAAPGAVVWDIYIHFEANDTVSYYTFNDDTNIWNNITDVAPRTTTEEGRIDYCYFRSSSGAAPASTRTDMDIDDISLEFETITGATPSGEIPDCCPTCTEVGIVGITGTTYRGRYSIWGRYNLLAARYNVPITGLINRVDLQINEDMGQYLNANGINLVWAKINGFDIGLNTECVRISNSAFRLTWTNLAVNITNDIVVIMFNNTNVFTASNGQQVYWSVYGANNVNDDGENWFKFFEVSSSVLWYQFDSYYDIIQNERAGEYRVDQDLVWRFCYIYDSDWEINTNLENDLILTPSTVCINESIRIDWFLNLTSMLSDAKYITVSRLGVEVANHTVYNQQWYVYYTPLAAGLYYVNISVDGVAVVTETFTVVCERLDYIFTSPNPSFPGGPFEIEYKYTSYAFPGRLVIEGTGTYWDLVQGDQGNVTHRLYFGGIYIFRLYQFQNGAWIPILDADHTHYVSSVANTFIDFSPNPVRIDRDVTFTGYHSHLGSNIWIQVGNSFIQGGFVGNDESFEVDWSPKRAGSFPVSLVYVQGNTRIPIYTSPDRLIVQSVSGGEENWEEMLGDFAIWLGAGIIVIFLVFPMGLAAFYYIEVPVLVYVAFGAIGTGLAVGLGLLPMYWMLLMIVALIVGAVVTVFR